MTTDDAGRLMLWLRGMVEDMAHDLLEAGWEESQGGLWREYGDVRGPWLHIFDAHEKMKRGLATQGRVVR
jgi:hypothetical protein